MIVSFASLINICLCLGYVLFNSSERSPIVRNGVVPMCCRSNIGWSRFEEDETSITRQPESEATSLSSCYRGLLRPLHIFL